MAYSHPNLILDYVPVNHDSKILLPYSMNDVTSCIKMAHEGDTLKQVFWYYTLANLRKNSGINFRMLHFQIKKTIHTIVNTFRW
jgi:hypothetical protein